MEEGAGVLGREFREPLLDEGDGTGIAGREDGAVGSFGERLEGEAVMGFSRLLPRSGQPRTLDVELQRAPDGDEAAEPAPHLHAVTSDALGPHAEAVRAGAETAGLDRARIVVATTHAELASHLRAYCRSGDLLLLKGSRGAAMEEVLRHLAADSRTETTP